MEFQHLRAAGSPGQFTLAPSEDPEDKLVSLNLPVSVHVHVRSRQDDGCVSELCSPDQLWT